MPLINFPQQHFKISLALRVNTRSSPFEEINKMQRFTHQAPLYSKPSYSTCSHHREKTCCENAVPLPGICDKANPTAAAGDKESHHLCIRMPRSTNVFHLRMGLFDVRFFHVYQTRNRKQVNDSCAKDTFTDAKGVV